MKKIFYVIFLMLALVGWISMASKNLLAFAALAAAAVGGSYWILKNRKKIIHKFRNKQKADKNNGRRAKFKLIKGGKTK